MYTPLVYKICRSESRLTRSSGIRLRQLFLKGPGYGYEMLVLLEPFLLFYHTKLNVSVENGRNVTSIFVYNLLEPNTAPMKIERGPSMTFCYFWDRKMCRGSPFESDMRTNGELPASVQFLVVYKPTATTLCFECLEIKTSGISTLWSRIVDVEFDEFEYDIFSIDRDNYVVRIIDENTDRDQYHHVILSTAKITKYQHSLAANF